MTSDVGLNKDGAAKTGEALNNYLSDLHIFYGKLHCYHWNVEGPEFFPLHTKLEEVYDGVAEAIDEVAERILTIGVRPVSTFKEYLERSKLQEAPSRAYSGDEVVKSVLADLKHLIAALRGIIEVAGEGGDEVTVDLCVGALSGYEKTVWMLSAHLG